MDARLHVDIGYCTDKLGKDALDLVDWERPMFEKIVVKLVPWYLLACAICICASQALPIPEQYSNTIHTSVSVIITS
jgi:hypothetical protein